MGKAENSVHQDASHTLERKLFRLAVIVAACAVVGAFIPFLGLVVSLPFFMVALLWLYGGIALFCVTFPLAFFLALHKGNTTSKASLSAARWFFVLIIALGLLMWPTCFFVPGYKPFTLGYWVHCKIWLNPSEVRDWASVQPAPSEPISHVPYRQWPMSLKFASLGSGRVTVDSNKKVTLVDGGGFGHWGIEIGKLDGSQPETGDYSIQLSHGAWVWHEVQ